MNKHIGLDFDNTLVLYDELFYQYALSTGTIEEDIPHTKIAVRKFLIDINMENIFTEMQGIVYGRLIKEAPIQNGLIESIQLL